MSISERYLSYAVPPVISSSEFTTEFITYQPSGSQRDFAQGDSFTISLANLNKAQYLLPDSCTLAFDITVSAQAGTTPPTVVASGNYDVGVMHTVDTVPRPYFGCPFFDSATCAVPGSASFDALPSSAEETAQYWYSTRLLASSVPAEGSLDRGATFRLPGRYNYAGGKSGYERAACISGGRKVMGSDGATPVADPISLRGGSLSYAIPLSAFCTLFSKSSSLIPVGMLSSGGEALVFQFTVARDVASVLGIAPNTAGFGAISFKILNPRILASVVRVQNPVTVAQLSALYDARVKALLPGPTPDAPPTSISMPMVVAHKRFVWARTVIPANTANVLYSSSTLGLTFSGVNEPSVSAIVLRFRYRPGAPGIPDGAAARSSAIRYLGGEEPDIVIRDLQARINDQLIPLKGLTDEGASDTPVYKIDGVAHTLVPNDAANGPTLIAQTADAVASSLFDLGRPGLGMWMEDDHAMSLSDVVFDRTSCFGSYAQATTDTLTMRSPGLATTNLLDGASTKPVTCRKSPMALFIIPLVSLPQLVGDYANSHTLRSWDLRSVSTFSVTASVQVKVDAANGGPGAGVTTGAQINSYITAPLADVICDGALVCDGMLRLAAGSSDSRYVYTSVANATVAGM